MLLYNVMCMLCVEHADEMEYIDVVPTQPLSTTDVYFYHYIKRDRLGLSFSFCVYLLFSCSQCSGYSC